MNIFHTHSKIIENYSTYIRSFLNIADPEISSLVDHELSQGKLWPEPLLQFNPSFEMAGSVDELTNSSQLHPALADIFKGYSLYRHQVEAIRLGLKGQDFIVTSGTGSGKSLTYIGTVFHYLLNNPTATGVVGIVVYPMNALINSQFEEFDRYRENYEQATGLTFPISFGQYTGQEKEEKRQGMREHPPQVLLTNYMMLELLLTRIRERNIREAIYENLRFLVFDELHTYRGRQGADVAMLIRRIRSRCTNEVRSIGTSATMVAGGNLTSQRKQIAEVATVLFGRPFSPDQIVVETLTRSLTSVSKNPEDSELATSIQAGIPLDNNAETLKTHPVAVWLENNVALEEQDGCLIRRQPQEVSEIITALAKSSGLETEQCKRFLIALLQWISGVNQRLQEAGHRYTVLPFKLHQFISQTGSVYSTLDFDGARFITLEPGIYKQDDEGKKPIYPNVFSRASGEAFICVSRVGNRLEPREFREFSDDEETTDGYLIIGEDVWLPQEDLENLPDSWLLKSRKGPKATKRPFFPNKLYFDEFGQCSETTPLKYWGWFMKAPLLFDPTGGVFYDTKTNEGTKLTKLGSEGRSTSTTITAFTILNQLNEGGYHPNDQKLLSFTDNRQDAALQAGHFNDFVQVIQLRAGIHKALLDAPAHLITFATLGESIFKALNLPFPDFATRKDGSTFPHIQRPYEQCFQNYLVYRALADLRRSWRIVLPNLEQCGLLRIEFQDLAETSATDAAWSDIPLLKTLRHEERREFLYTILDFFRLEYAIHSENYLTQSKIKENEKLFREMLRPPWTLDRNENLREPFFIRYDPLAKSVKVASKSMGPASAFGKYVKLFVKQKGLELNLKGDHYRDFILTLMDRLVDADYLISKTVRSEKNEETPVYRLRIDKIIWLLGDGKTVKNDVIKRRSYRQQNPRPNEFFRDIYQRDFSATKRLRAEDHTGQLGTDTRIERENLFREGKISALFCSPTMELGIDIGGLSVVHMRNAPPNPSNYAQRSGRAGRSGQGALIFTYCSSYSPHDRHYFQQQKELVAGAVQPPRIDLCNQELLLTHLNALAISEVGLPGLDGHQGEKPSVMQFVEDDGNKMPLSPSVRAGLDLSPGTFNVIKSTFKQVVQDFEKDLENKAAGWFSEQWTEQNLSRLADHLDESLHRWRGLYRSARTILTRATQRIESGTLSLGSEEYRKYKRNQDQATRQLDLLRNNFSGKASELSEFYPYRYLASEGFLPGYNFTRLPLRVFLPTSDSTGDFISRPRTIALREFGPLNIIYHNGRKFRVTQLVVQDTDASQSEAKISKKAGYFLPPDQKDLEVCPFTGLDLSDNANTEHLHHLVEMTESRAEEVDRITCEEEERRSLGFAIKTYFSVDGGQLDRIKKATVVSSENTLLNLRFIPAARLVHVNYGWRSQRSNGFPIGLVSGDWRSSMPDAESNYKEAFNLVKLWTSNLADALYIEPVQPLGLTPEGVITFQYALKRAIENIFQVESNEIGAVSIGDQETPNILLFEAAEGSLGILSQFVEDVAVFRQVIQQAVTICRYEDETYKDPASYDDLLSYYNQRDHRSIDRHLIKDALVKLLICDIEIQSNTGFRNYEEHYQSLLRGIDSTSSTELKFLNYLYENDLRLPDAAQKRVEGVFVQPDFYYEPRFWVFCDGTPHDSPAVQVDDEAKRQAIIARGDEVWVYYYRDNLAEKIEARSDIFRKVR